MMTANIRNCLRVIDGLRLYYDTIRRVIMPVHRTKSGGYKWGKSGKTYYGKGAKAKAARQGRAIKRSGWKEK